MILVSVNGVVSGENVRNASRRWCSGVGVDVKMAFRGPRGPGRAEQGRTGSFGQGDRAAPGCSGLAFRRPGCAGQKAEGSKKTGLCRAAPG
jgi:hypothetical protein